MSVGGDVVLPGHHVQILPPDAGLDVGGLAEDACVVGIAGVEALAGDADAAAAHLDLLEHAVVDNGAAGGEGDAGGVDEAAAVDLDAGRVGQYHLGAAAGDFNIAV